MLRSFVVLLATGTAISCSAGSTPDATIGAVRPLGPMDRPASVVGRDGGTSGRFAGRSVWVYGDTVATLAGTFPTNWRNNTMSWTSDLDASDGLTGFVQPADALGAPREFYPRTDEEAAFDEAHIDRGDGTCAAPCGARYAIWGSGPIEVTPGRAVLAYAKVYGEPGEFNFHIVGNSIATWTDFDAGPERPSVQGGLEDTILFDARDGEFGIPAFDGTSLYLFSCSGGDSDGRGCLLARAPIDDVLQRSAWTFRTADGWTSDVTRATALFDGSPNMTVHYNHHLDRWIAVYMDWGTIVLRTAPAIDGPWSGTGEIFSPSEDDTNMGLAHAELSEDDGAVEYISYLSDAGFRLLRVELAPITR